MTLNEISKTVLDPNSSRKQLHGALDQFAQICSKISNLEPDPTYTAWSDDTFLSQGVAINPNAAAYCIKDYQRSVAFIRGVYGALKRLRTRADAASETEVLYAGCGPFATLLLPVLHLFDPSELHIHLIDIHQSSLDSVATLISSLGLSEYRIELVQADACTYQHSAMLDLVIVETMQKALEQEPQLAVTANLAPQLATNGIFIPEEINIELCLAHLDEEHAACKAGQTLNELELISKGKRQPISKLMQLSASSVCALTHHRQGTFNDHPKQTISNELALGKVTIPDLENLGDYQPILFTRISVFAEHRLNDYESSLTLPSRCVELEPLVPGACYRASYALGSYPKIQWQREENGK